MFTFDEKNHIYRIDGVIVPGITTVLSDMGFIDKSWFTEEGRQRGTFVHRIIEWHILEQLDYATVDPALQPYFDAWLRFVKDTGYESVAVEEPRVSELWRFGCTPDHEGSLNGKRVLIDVKTGSISKWVGLQLAGQALTFDEPRKRYGLQLTGEGKYKLTEFKDRNDTAIVQAAISCWWWIKNHGGK